MYNIFIILEYIHNLHTRLLFVKFINDYISYIVTSLHFYNYYIIRNIYYLYLYYIFVFRLNLLNLNSVIQLSTIIKPAKQWNISTARLVYIHKYIHKYTHVYKFAYIYIYIYIYPKDLFSAPSSSQYTSSLYMILSVNFQMYTITFTLMISNYIPSYPTPLMYYQITHNYVNVHQLSDHGFYLTILYSTLQNLHS